MKVRVVLSVDVDPQAWRDEYGERSKPASEIADAIRWAVLDAVLAPGVIVPGASTGENSIIRDADLKA